MKPNNTSASWYSFTIATLTNLKDSSLFSGAQILAIFQSSVPIIGAEAFLFVCLFVS